MIHSVNITTGIVTELPDEPGIPDTIPTQAQLMKQEIIALQVDYKATMATYHQAWLVASVTDGETEVTKKAAIKQNLADLSAEYAANVAAVKVKYTTPEGE